MRKLILVGAVVYFLVLGVVAVLFLRARPGPESQEILGVGIARCDTWATGNYMACEEGWVYLSGRRLDCTPRAEDEPAICTVALLGETLSIHAKRSSAPSLHQLNGTCRAYYRGQEFPCHVNSRHIHVPWFAYVGAPLGLSPSQLDAVEAKYPIENLEERFFFPGFLIVSSTTALVAVAAVLAALWPRVRGKKVVLALTAAVTGATSLVGSLILAFLVTRGLWD